MRWLCCNGAVRRETVVWSALVGTGVAYIAAAIVLGTTPKATDSGATVAAWFRTHASNVHWWLWLETLAVVLFAVLAAFVRSRLPVIYRDVFLIGAITLVAETVAQGWIWAGMAWHADVLQPATARTLLDVASYWGPVLTSSTVLMLGPVAVLALRREAGLPMWLGVVTAVALVEQLVETITIFGHRGFIAPGGPMNLLLGAGLTLIALGATAVVTARTLAPLRPPL